MGKEEYLQAAKILATCPVKRLPQVIKLLREAGIEVDEGELGAKLMAKKEARRERLSEERAANYAVGFWDSEDEFVSALRGAFENGIGVSELSRVAGMSRTAIYRYLHERTTPSEAAKARVLNAIEKIMEDC